MIEASFYLLLCVVFWFTVHPAVAMVCFGVWVMAIMAGAFTPQP